jgi:hypothetical protein
MFTIIAQLPTCFQYRTEVDENSTILQVKQKTQERHGIDFKSQRMILPWRGELADNQTGLL